MQAPKLPSMFRNVQKEPRRFKLKTRHYNPRDYELEQRKKSIEAEMGVHGAADEPPVKRISIVERRKERGTYRSANRASTLRMLALLGALGLVCWRLYNWLMVADA